MGNRLALWRERCSEVEPWFAAATVAVSVGVLANAVQASAESWLARQSVSHPVLFFRVSSFAVFVLAVYWLYHLRQNLFPPRTRFLRHEKSPEKRKHLVIFLSKLDPRGPFQHGVPEGIGFTGDLTKDLDALAAAKEIGIEIPGQSERRRVTWPWEMPLRGIAHHVGRLSSVTIVCSEESIRQVGWFVEVLKAYPALREVDIWLAAKNGDRAELVNASSDFSQCGGWDFEVFDDLSRAVVAVIRFLKEQRVAPAGRQRPLDVEKEIMIDLTSGQKPTSVVAATVTFNRPIKTQYVQTNSPYAVVSYDLVFRSNDTGGLAL